MPFYKNFFRCQEFKPHLVMMDTEMKIWSTDRYQAQAINKFFGLDWYQVLPKNQDIDQISLQADRRSKNI